MFDQSLNYSSFFAESGFPFNDIFKNTKYVWEALPKISEYLNQVFSGGKIKANYNSTDNIFIGSGTTIEEGVKIIGPAVIGKNCTIKHGAFLRENCIIGDNVTIGHAVEIKNSILLNNASVSHLNYIGDSIIGNTVNISGGVITANYRLDKQPVQVKIDSQRIVTNLQKLGAVIGDNSTIGVNAVLNPGTLLGKRTLVYPLTSVTGYHKDDETIK